MEDSYESQHLPTEQQQQEQQHQHLLHNEHQHHFWSINGRFPPTDSSEALLGLGEPTPLVPPSSSPTQQQQQQHDPEQQAITNVWDHVLTIVCVVVLMSFLMLRLRGRGRPGPEHHRGHLIREQARRIWEVQERKARRRAATPSKRLAAIRKGVRTATVVRTDPSTGICELRIAAGNSINHPNDDPHLACSNPSSGGSYLHGGAMSATSTSTTDLILGPKPSTDTIDTIPLNQDVSLESDEDDRSHDVCTVCLEGFDPGDTVLFARNLSLCTHVFHEECLLSWLLERRENECPSCRAPLVRDDDDDGVPSMTDTTATAGNGGGDGADEEVSAVPAEPEKDGTNVGLAHRDDDDDFVDLEEGRSRTIHGDGREASQTYFIVQGRVVAATIAAASRVTTAQRESEAGGNHSRDGTLGLSHYEAEETHAVTRKGMTSLLEGQHSLERRSALSVTSLQVERLSFKKTNHNSNESEFLSLPLPLDTSRSFPMHNPGTPPLLPLRRSRSCHCRCGVTFSEEKSASRKPNSALEGRPPRLTKELISATDKQGNDDCTSYHQYLKSSDRVVGPIDRSSPRIHDGCYCYESSLCGSGSGSDDSFSSNDEDAICRMVYHHHRHHQGIFNASTSAGATAGTISAFPRNAASIFAHGHC